MAKRYTSIPVPAPHLADGTMGDIRVAVAGTGNLCSSLVQGTHFYAKAKEPLGLLHPKLGGYKPSDVKYVAAFDISDVKVGKDLGDAIYAKPNNAPKMVDVPKLGIEFGIGGGHGWERLLHASIERV